jgi:hypothetical protein
VEGCYNSLASAGLKVGRVLQERVDVLANIEESLSELRDIAQAKDFDLLTYLLEAASIEVRDELAKIEFHVALSMSVSPKRWLS